MGYSLWGSRGLDTTEKLTTTKKAAYNGLFGGLSCTRQQASTDMSSVFAHPGSSEI